MFEGFTEISAAAFYGQVWPKISREAEPLKSNWKTPCDECFPPWLIIHWGMRDPETGEKVEVAVSISDGDGPDRHWVAPHLI